MIIGISVDASQVLRQISDIERQHLPFATAIALTATASYARKQVINEMRHNFDRPKPTTVNETRGPLYVKSADYRKLRAGENDYAEVRVKDYGAVHNGDPAIAWLSHNIRGGLRIEKRSETLMRRAGILFPGYYAVPGAGAKLDRYGNMSSGQIQQILSALGAQRDVYQNTRRGRSASWSKGQQDYFIAYRGRPQTRHLAEGVWQRYGRGKYEIRPVLIFVKGAPRYRKRVRFYEICEQSGRFRFHGEFHAAMARALTLPGSASALLVAA